MAWIANPFARLSISPCFAVKLFLILVFLTCSTKETHLFGTSEISRNLDIFREAWVDGLEHLIKIWRLVDSGGRVRISFEGERTTPPKSRDGWKHAAIIFISRKSEEKNYQKLEKMWRLSEKIKKIEGGEDKTKKKIKSSKELKKHGGIMFSFFQFIFSFEILATPI